MKEIEGYQSRYDNFNVYRKVREVAEKFRNNGSGKITDEESNLIITKDEKKKVWERYMKKLFHDLRTDMNPSSKRIQDPKSSQKK